jgi:hypothetical protein
MQEIFIIHDCHDAMENREKPWFQKTPPDTGICDSVLDI